MKERLLGHTDASLKDIYIEGKKRRQFRKQSKKAARRADCVELQVGPALSEYIYGQSELPVKKIHGPCVPIFPVSICMLNSKFALFERISPGVVCLD